MRGIILVTLPLLVSCLLFGASAQSQDLSSARAKCVQFGFKEKTKDHDECVKQVLISTASKVTAPPTFSIKQNAVPMRAKSPFQLEEDYWRETKKIDNKEAYEAYLDKYPMGRYIDLARAQFVKMNMEFDQQLLIAVALEKERITKETAQRLEAEETKKRVEAEAAIEKQRLAAEAAQRQATSKPASGQVIKDCWDCPEMVVITSGSFMMGSAEDASEQPVHRVNISKFLIGKTKVTQGQWKSVMGYNFSGFVGCGDDCPVERVSWNDAQQFIEKLRKKTGEKYRLPSEAEWEYAARGGTNTRWSFGDDESKLADYAWYEKNSGYKTHLVGQKPPNPFGLYDVSGNVWEWTQDCWHENYAGAPTDGSAWTTACNSNLRVIRGGSEGVPNFV